MKAGFRALSGRLAPISVLGLAGFSALSSMPARPVGPVLVPLAIAAPHITPTEATGPAACTAPDGTQFAFFHCYTPAQIATAYGLDAVHNAGFVGERQTIVLVA